MTNNNDAYQDAVTKLMSYLNDTVVFAKEQLPDVAKQMLLYGADVHHFWFIIFCVLAGLSFVSFLVSLVSGWEFEGTCILSFIAMVVCVIVAGSQYAALVKIQDAPKLYIMDELADRLHK